jgi:hypothetical protein
MDHLACFLEVAIVTIASSMSLAAHDIRCGVVVAARGIVIVGASRPQRGCVGEAAGPGTEWRSPPGAYKNEGAPEQVLEAAEENAPGQVYWIRRALVKLPVGGVAVVRAAALQRVPYDARLVALLRSADTGSVPSYPEPL